MCAGRRPLIEEVLRAEPGPWRVELLRHLLAVELAYRRRGGEAPGSMSTARDSHSSPR